MIETDKLFIKQNTIDGTIKWLAIESHLPIAKYIKFREFMRGQTMTNNEQGETIIFIEDFENFLNNKDHLY